MYSKGNITHQQLPPPSSPCAAQLVSGGDLGLGVIGITYTPTPCSRGLGVVGGATVPAIGDLAPVPEGARRLRAFQQW
jgi:hypothetical protein